MSSYQLSYILSTRNRLPFLKILFEEFFSLIGTGEEIVVVDGDSTDGSKEYLAELFQRGVIHQFVSEPDRGQAQGWNKAMLMSTGILLKKITDDDVFSYTAISECKEYMLRTPQSDVVISNDLFSSLSDPGIITKNSRLEHFNKWKKGAVPSFTFGDVHMMVRRSSLSYIGLYHTAFVMLDWEYSLRISYLRTGIHYYSGYNALSVAHNETVTSNRDQKLVKEQGKKGCKLYDYNGDAADISYWSAFKIAAGKLTSGKNTDKPVSELVAPASIYHQFYKQLSGLAAESDYTFTVGP